jgi:hypothetical protein
MEADWSLVLVGLALWLLGSVDEGLLVEGVLVEGLVGCCWSGVEVEPALPVCANAIPEVSISAKINFLFIIVAPSIPCPSGL